MIREIVKDPLFLARKSQPAGEEDIAVGRDLIDTIEANRAGCVGMAANMIGQLSRIIVFYNDDGRAMLMFNPEIIKCSGAYEAEEGCLSLSGVRKTKRYKSIKVRYQNEQFQTRLKTFEGWMAQIIQHETDHCNGILI